METVSQNAPDGGILAEVARGGDKAMERCIARYGGLVWSIAQRHLRDQSAAEDAVQEIFMDLWKSAGRYDSKVATEATFIGMLARRRTIDLVRKQSRRPETEPMPDVDSLPYASSEPHASVRCERADVRSAVATLPEQTQQLFALHFDEGMTHPEIADKTGLPLGTVKTQLRRGLIEVRNTLRRLEGGNLSPAAAR